jgi:3-methyl-2-oxobutanoate hydroxymethyltransferase
MTVDWSSTMSASTPEETAPYGSGPAKPGSAAAAPVKRVRTHHLREMKERGERFSMLTAYEQYAAQTSTVTGSEVSLP